MAKTKEHTEASIIKIWKKKGVDKVEMTFDCGGDSMGETDFTVFLKDGSTESEGELIEYFEDSVYQNVNFYEASDGHYEGEQGTVVITYDEDEDALSYDKNAQSRWNESDSEDVWVKLTPKEAAYLRENVLNINADNENEMSFNYKREFVMTDSLEAIEEKLGQKIERVIAEAHSDLEIESLNEWYSYTTSSEGDLTIEKNKLKVVLNYSYEELRDGDD